LGEAVKMTTEKMIDVYNNRGCNMLTKDILNRYHNWLKGDKSQGEGGEVNADELFLRSLDFRIDTCYRPFEIEYNTTPEKLERIVTHIESTWSRYGEGETFWSVLTSPNFLKKNLTSDVAFENFYSSGKNDIMQIEMTLQRCGEWDVLHKDSCLEYGCGVGRVTLQLSSVFDSVLGLIFHRVILHRPKNV
jgi:hypothetical protein